MLIDDYIYTYEFSEMIFGIVFEDAEVKAESEKHNELIENLSLDFETRDLILCSINAMVARAIKVAYKKGFQDGVNFIANCSNSHNDTKKDLRGRVDFMKTINIMDLINMRFKDHDLEISNKIKAASGYEEAEEKFKELVNSLDKQIMLDIDEVATYMETVSRDVAFNEGFRLAIQLILSSTQ